MRNCIKKLHNFQLSDNFCWFSIF
ncbi:hypothetical protein Pint_19609 [Pistacia integerrima]|uniref:Uncharacterized protein n=1 Tax=Pistacia integerrima TaxID=434235 RepID=A0ACC0XBK4_9ROSI|nr:hypothetical protein Pint_19609 [Pistacia integerrima]